ncbi:hypothetical protein CVT25_008630 [Psilocybe cyanescens]|uniref:Uncharacterized protein n=1 Tax=Psilocybe cyanescens TaxID=93625 RepID=A0A409XDC3_PSICY|nr:hypothetical protein CVT25_008630 [Psilocybe cyanescens]
MFMALGFKTKSVAGIVHLAHLPTAPFTGLSTALCPAHIAVTASVRQKEEAEEEEGGEKLGECAGNVRCVRVGAVLEIESSIETTFNFGLIILTATRLPIPSPSPSPSLSFTPALSHPPPQGQNQWKHRHRHPMPTDPRGPHSNY